MAVRDTIRSIAPQRSGIGNRSGVCWKYRTWEQVRESEIDLVSIGSDRRSADDLNVF